MAAVADGSASPAAVKEVEYQAGVQKLVDMLSKLNPAAEEFVPSSKKALSADAPVFDYYSIGGGNVKNMESAVNTTFYSGNQQHYWRRNRYITQGRRRTIQRMTRAERVDSIRRTVYVSELDQTVTEETLANIFTTCGQIVDCRICGDPRSVLRFAFVEFSDDDGARAALGLDGTILGFYPVRVSPSKTAILPVNPKYLPKTEDERKMVMRTIYYTNIDKMVTELDVKNFFVELCGEVSRLKLRGDNEHSTRITFVEFVRETQHFRGDGAACVERGARHAAENPLSYCNHGTTSHGYGSISRETPDPRQM